MTLLHGPTHDSKVRNTIIGLDPLTNGPFLGGQGFERLVYLVLKKPVKIINPLVEFKLILDVRTHELLLEF